jgi:hypothetical protein
MPTLSFFIPSGPAYNFNSTFFFFAPLPLYLRTPKGFYLNPAPGFMRIHRGAPSRQAWRLNGAQRGSGVPGTSPRDRVSGRGSYAHVPGGSSRRTPG